MSLPNRYPNPVCPQPDDVQQVRVVYDRGTPQHHVEWQGSALSQQLAPPAWPGQNGGWATTLRWAGRVGCTVLAGLLSAIGFFGFAAMVGGVLMYHNIPPFETLPAALATSGFLGLAVVPGGIFVLSVVAAYRGADTDYRRARAARQRMQSKWEQLYYCRQCDSVFNPNEGGRFVPASCVQELLS